MKNEVVAVIGAGGIGEAIARRQGAGRTVLLGDVSDKVLNDAAKRMRDAGLQVETEHVDVTSRASVKKFAATASGLGSVSQMVLTAGVSPNMATPAKILAVDLVGTALVLEVFREVIVPGGSGVIISSMAGHMPPPLPLAQNEALARTPVDELLSLPFLQPTIVTDPSAAYCLAKQANHVRVQQESIAWGERGARVNSISPGIIVTPLALHELASPTGPAYRAMIDASSAKRMGTVDEVATAAAFLLNHDASFITGSDLLMDGGVIAAMRAGRMNAPSAPQTH